MSRDDELSDEPGPLKANLVAYLDGELDAETSREVENLLAADPSARDEMNRMEQAWDLLGELPRAEVDEAFTRSTIEMVAVSAAEEISLLESDLPRQRRRRLLAGLLGLAASLSLGFVSVYALWPNPNEQLLRDLPVLEQLDQYRQVESVDFLRRLADQELLPTTAETLGEPTTLAQRQLQIEQLSPTEKESLLRKQQRFVELPPNEQQRIRTLHTEIQQDPQAAALRGVLSTYYDWLLSQSPPQRASLASLDTDSRIEKIDKLRKEELQRELTHLSPADLEAVAGWLEEQIQSRMPQTDPPLQLQDLAPTDRRGALMLLAWSRSPTFMGASQLNPAALASLREVLSPAGQAKLDQLDTEEKRRRVLVGWGDGWLSQAIRNSIKRYHDSLMADVSKEDMVRFFEELPAEERGELERASSPESREMRLRMMYLRKYKSQQMPAFARDLKFEPWWWRPRGDGRGGDNRGPSMGSPRERDPNRDGTPPPGPPRRGPG